MKNEEKKMKMNEIGKSYHRQMKIITKLIVQA